MYILKYITLIERLNIFHNVVCEILFCHFISYLRGPPTKRRYLCPRDYKGTHLFNETGRGLLLCLESFDLQLKAELAFKGTARSSEI